MFLGSVGLVQVVALGASGFFGGFYDFTVWGVASAATLVALAAALVVRPRPPSGPAVVVAGGLLALLLISALSLTWADSVDRAWTEVNRLVFYLATFVLATIVLRPGRSVRVIAVVTGAAIGLCALVTLGRLLAGDASAFLIHRLDAPVEYINGTACLMLMGIWPLVAVAERDRPPWLAGLAVALASVEASLLVLTQSRAVIPAMLGSALVLLGVIPGRVARFWTVAAVASGAAAALPWTLAVYAQHDPAHPDGPSSTVVAHAGLATLLAALAAGLLWAAARAVAARPLPGALRRAPRLGVILLLMAAPVVVLAVDHDPLGTVRHQWRAFTALRDTATTSAVRFTDAGGFRYDLWRVAVKEFDREPLRGSGAGSFGLRYFQLRSPANPESVRQPHSLELQLLAELGLPGLLTLLICLGGVGLALARTRAREAALSVALGGTFLVWLLDTSVDWVYNMPGLTGMALLGAAGLCVLAGGRGGAGAPDSAEPAAMSLAMAAPPAALGGRASRRGSGSAARDPRTLAWMIAVIALVAVGGPSLVRQYLAQHRGNAAAAEVAIDPQRALADTHASLSFDTSRIETYYTRAAAFARLEDYRDSRDTLLQAVRIEPLNYVPWALLGDLATRRGAAGVAAMDYGRARALDPGDAGLFTSAAGG